MTLALLIAVSSSAPAQDGSETAERTVAGRILRPVERELVPVRDLWVTLHRIGHDTAGPLDSVRTDVRGAYQFRYRPSGDEDAIYFAAALFGGVAYFTPPLVARTVRGESAEIVVFDTSSSGVPVSVRGRHLVVSAADADARRSIVEVYELANDTTVTLVSPTAESPPTWVGRLPDGARDPRVTDGDVPGEAVSFAGGEVRVVSPIPPGIKQLAYSYFLPATAFPLSVPLSGRTDVYEVLIEDPSGTARGALLNEVEGVAVGGRTFRRFLAQDVPSGAVAVVEIPRASAGRGGAYIIGLAVLIGVTMAFALTRTLRRAPAS